MCNNEQETANHYDQILQKGLNNLVNNTDKEPVSRFFAEVGVEHKNIIDVGCGAGEIAELAAATKGQWNSYHGVDIGEEVVAEFNKKGIPRAVAAVGSATELKRHADNSKDLLICLFLLQDLCPEDGKKALRELRRVAKHDANVLIGLTVNKHHTEDIKRYANKKIRAVVGEKWTYIWNVVEIKRVLKEEGFSIVKQEVLETHPTYIRLYVKARVLK